MNIPNVTENLDLEPGQSPGIGQSQPVRISNTDDVEIVPAAGAFAAVRNQVFSHVRYKVIALVFLFSCVFSSPSQEILSSLSNEEKIVLEAFFRSLLRDSSGGGCVIFGEKPVYWESVRAREGDIVLEHQSVSNPSYRHSIIIKRGVQVWQKIAQFSPRFLIQIYDTPTRQWKDVVFINRTTFKDVVNKNLNLFQYALGPQTSAETLLQKLEKNDENFPFIFKNDKVLFGIILGFGTQNSLIASRLEYIDDSLADPKNVLPLKSPHVKSMLAKRRPLSHLDKESFYRNCGAEPSFNFETLEEEKQELKKGEALSLDTHPAPPLIPWFGCWKSEETTSLLKSYSNTRIKIKTVLSSECFLEEVFKKIFDENT